MEWRAALGAAQHALQGSGRPGLLPAAEVNARANALRQEREAASAALDSLAREEHVRLARHVSSPPTTHAMLGLPPEAVACVFDLEGVLTGSAALHAAAWKATFNELLYARFERLGERFAPYVPFSRSADYPRYVQRRPRLDGVRRFLESRGISLPEGVPDDPAGSETVHGLANRKQELFLRLLDRQGVRAFAGSHRYLELARDLRLPCMVVSASANTARLLGEAGLAHLVEREPAATAAAACARAAIRPRQAAVFETTPDAIAADRAAGFGLVVAVDRTGRADALRAAGADVVVTDLADLLRL